MGTLGTDEVSDDSSDDRLLEAPAPVNPAMFGILGERLEYEDV
jgi:hypothetical protein